MFQRNRLRMAILAASTTLGTPIAQGAIDELVVTATKRSESTQDIAVAVQALGGDRLNELGIANFEDYLLQLPSITAGGSGPGQSTIYIRGLASTTPNLTTAGVAGLAPNVALYLDEQPLSQPGRNLDVYAADFARVEVLAGPQGTLFGASSQAGTVRLITNKPDPSSTYSNVKLNTAFTKNGEPSNSVEGMINLPVTERLTLRGVVYVDNQGGYIDNVSGTRSVRSSARFREAGTMRANGVPVSSSREGLQALNGTTTDGPRNLDDVTFIESDNATRVEDDINETTYSGARLAARYELNEDWDLQVAHMVQSLDSEGVFFADPNLGDYEIQRFQDDKLEDEFSNTAWTLQGRLRDLEITYTGAYTDRETDQVVDYSDYLFVGQYLPYYICDSAVTYPGAGEQPGEGTCQAPDMLANSFTHTKIQTHEFRISTPAEHRLRATVGAFYSDLELAERNDFAYPGSTRADVFGTMTGADGSTRNFAENYPYDTGYTSDSGPFPDEVIFRNDVLRTDEQFGLFGEVSFDLTEQFALTLGARYYDIEVDFQGSANSSFCNSYQADAQKFGTDISDLYNADGRFTWRNDCGEDNITFTVDQTLEEIENDERLTDAQALRVFNSLRAPDAATASGVIGKVSLSWAPNDDMLWYLTWSEGFRPGLLNRPGGVANADDNYTVPFALKTDEVVNYEFGWKLDLFGRTLRLNSNVFYVDIQDLQTTIFDPSIVNLFFSDNAADAEIRGIEGDFIWSPGALQGLTVSGGFSFLDTEITRVTTPTEDVRKGDELAFAPAFQGALQVRYEWSFGQGLKGHLMPHLSYSGESFSDIITINRDKIDSWLLVGLTAGVSRDNWTAEFFVDNLFDEKAELARSFTYDVERVTYARPLTGGLRVSFGF